MGDLPVDSGIQAVLTEQAGSFIKNTSIPKGYPYPYIRAEANIGGGKREPYVFELTQQDGSKEYLVPFLARDSRSGTYDKVVLLSGHDMDEVYKNRPGEDIGGRTTRYTGVDVFQDSRYDKNDPRFSEIPVSSIAGGKDGVLFRPDTGEIMPAEKSYDWFMNVEGTDGKKDTVYLNPNDAQAIQMTMASPIKENTKQERIKSLIKIAGYDGEVKSYSEPQQIKRAFVPAELATDDNISKVDLAHALDINHYKIVPQQEDVVSQAKSSGFDWKKGEDALRFSMNEAKAKIQKIVGRQDQPDMQVTEAAIDTNPKIEVYVPKAPDALPVAPERSPLLDSVPAGFLQQHQGGGAAAMPPESKSMTTPADDAHAKPITLKDLEKANILPSEDGDMDQDHDHAKKAISYLAGLKDEGQVQQAANILAQEYATLEPYALAIQRFAEEPSARRAGQVDNYQTTISASYHEQKTSMADDFISGGVPDETGERVRKKQPTVEEFMSVVNEKLEEMNTVGDDGRLTLEQEKKILKSLPTKNEIESTVREGLKERTQNIDEVARRAAQGQIDEVNAHADETMKQYREGMESLRSPEVQTQIEELRAQQESGARESAPAREADICNKLARNPVFASQCAPKP